MGFAVTTSILIYACTLSRNLKSKTYRAQYSTIERMVRKYSLVHWLGTCESQCTIEEFDLEARTWLEDVREKLEQTQYSQDYILNMDQTAVYFSMHAKRTLSPQGQRTIFIRKAKDDSKRSTAAFTITASGLQLQPCIVFKGVCSKPIDVFRENKNYLTLILLIVGQPNTRVEKGFSLPSSTAPQGPLYLCQKNTWMDERVMLQWINVVLKPYIATAPVL
jgi:hypothetical protein